MAIVYRVGAKHFSKSARTLRLCTIRDHLPRITRKSAMTSLTGRPRLGKRTRHSTGGERLSALLRRNPETRIGGRLILFEDRYGEGSASPRHSPDECNM